MRPLRVLALTLAVGLGVTLVGGLGDAPPAGARPATTTIPPVKTARPGHGPRKATPDKNEPIVEPWTQSPRYGAPWLASSGASKPSETPSPASRRTSGTVFEFFFWIIAALTTLVVGAGVTAGARSSRRAPWKAGATPTTPRRETAQPP